MAMVTNVAAQIRTIQGLRDAGAFGDMAFLGWEWVSDELAKIDNLYNLF
jgi:hypothetical protein